MMQSLQQANHSERAALPDASPHLAVLDGWRAISICLVLATHLLPLGPKSWRINEMTGPMGMALFFTLSGFLITRILIAQGDVPSFLIRRLFRIVPLAWLGLAIALPLTGTKPEDYLPNFLFFANLPPQHLQDITSHYWSLCVEVQFYVGVALLVALFGRRALYVLPVICLAITLHRIFSGALVDIVTWRRADEILAGVTLALVYSDRLGAFARQLLSRTNVYALLLLLMVCSHPGSGALNYARPYIAAALVGSSLLAPATPLNAVLASKSLQYIARISFALYVIHHLLMFTWLGTGDRLEKYLKRPFLIAATFALAHLSTFHFESRGIALGYRLQVWLRNRRGSHA